MVSPGVVFCILSPPFVVLGAAVVDPPFTARPEEVPAVPPPAWASAKVEDIARADAKAIVLSFILVFPL